MELQNKVLRLHTDGANPATDWHTRSVYNKDEINSIKDPSQGSRKEITSIPSPFARIHLFENAFTSVAAEAVGNYKTFEKVDAYHQLVSDALDVAEVFFRFEEYSNGRKLEIKTWNKNSEIAALEANPKHKLLAKTLKLYLNQDIKRTPFDKTDDFYILTCNHNIIGGTSPSTLFFAAHNENFKLATLGLGEGDDMFFDKIPCALYKRDGEFQRYLYSLFTFNPRLKTEMKPFWALLEENLKALQAENLSLYTQIKEIGTATYNIDAFNAEFVEAEVTKGTNTFISLLSGINHRRTKPESTDLSNEPFAIKATKSLNGKTPFAIQSNFARSLTYAGGTWKQGTNVPSSDSRNLEERQLPGTNRLHPYLTISDLFEPTLIRVPYPLDEDNFFIGKNNLKSSSHKANGKVDVPGADAYLLPLTPKFFEYFDLTYLEKSTPDGRRIFNTFWNDQGNFLVSLLIEVNSGDYMLYERLYEINTTPDIANNKGSIVDCRIDMGFYPLLYTKDDNGTKEVRQMAILLDGDITPNTKHRNYNVKFFGTDSTEVKPEYSVTRHDKQKGGRATAVFHQINNHYEFIQIEGDGNRGIVLPKWKEVQKGNESVKIAVDFGTTNSYMAVRFGNKEPQAIEIDYKNRIFTTLSDNIDHSNGLKEVIFRTFMDYTIGKEQAYNLPTRTVVTEPLGTNLTTAKAQTQISVPFLVEQKIPYSNEVYTSNLKWTKLTEKDGSNNEKRVRSFLGTFLTTARNFIAQKGGNLNDVELIWTYPSSMSTSNIANYAEIWDELGKKMFPNLKIKGLSEAIAPYYSWSSNLIKSGSYPVLNIDIGGGTTDVIIFNRDKPTHSTSFRFAGNAIFGSGYEDYLSQENGLVRKFKESFDAWFNSHQGTIYGLNDVYRGENGINSLGAADINSFLFSIENNIEVIENQIDPISYTKLLRQKEDVKVAFVVFYSSIVYHLAKMMKELNLEMPRQIALSGKGSGIIRLLDADSKLVNVASLAKIIFEKVYDKPYHMDGLDILIGEQSKERTCFGALKLKQEVKNDYENIVLLGENRLLKYKDDNPIGEKPMYYKDLENEELTDLIEKEVREYFDFFFALDTSFNFNAKLGTLKGDRLKACRQVLEQDLRHNIRQGLSLRLENVDRDDYVTDALFFYPLVGAIHQYLNHVAES
jgi:hypothetical protein